jgi:hypothetical protein
VRQRTEVARCEYSEYPHGLSGAGACGSGRRGTSALTSRGTSSSSSCRSAPQTRSAAAALHCAALLAGVGKALAAQCAVTCQLHWRLQVSAECADLPSVCLIIWLGAARFHDGCGTRRIMMNAIRAGSAGCALHVELHGRKPELPHSASTGPFWVRAAATDVQAARSRDGTAQCCWY